jgi:hypothetical protein
MTVNIASEISTNAEIRVTPILLLDLCCVEFSRPIDRIVAGADTTYAINKATAPSGIIKNESLG